MRLNLNKDNYNLISINDFKLEYPALKSDPKSLERLNFLLNLYREIYGKKIIETSKGKLESSLDPKLALSVDLDLLASLTKSDIKDLENQSKLDMNLVNKIEKSFNNLLKKLKRKEKKQDSQLNIATKPLLMFSDMEKPLKLVVKKSKNTNSVKKKVKPKKSFNF